MYCFPGATVLDLVDKDIEILANNPDISKVIVHADRLLKY